jgi:hypothetical protein
VHNLLNKIQSLEIYHSLRITPTIKAGVTDHVWDIEDILKQYNQPLKTLKFTLERVKVDRIKINAYTYAYIKSFARGFP